MANRRLQQVQQTFNQERKQPEAEITSLIRVRGRLHAQLQQTPETLEIAWRGLDFAKGDIIAFAPDESCIDSVQSVRALVGRFQQYDDTIEKPLDEAQEWKQKFESVLKSERQRLVVRLEREKKAATALENEVRLLRIRKNELTATQRVVEA
jgi:predicted nucleotidyltransferase